MKLKIFIVLVAVAAAWFIGRGVVRINGTTASVNAVVSAATTGEGREEIRQSYKLAPGARVEVRGINGSVRIDTADTDTAEVYVVRTAHDRSDLERQKVLIEHTDTSLSVSTEKTDDSWWKHLTGSKIRTEVTLRLPRRVELTTKGINGPVTVGEVDGTVHVGGVNGRVEVGRSTGSAEVSGVNGSVTLGIARLGAEGVTVKGVNGGVFVRAMDALNADLNVKGLNGSVTLSVPNVTEQERGRSSLTARIGAGGAPITIKGVNGSVRFESAATSEKTN